MMHSESMNNKLTKLLLAIGCAVVCAISVQDGNRMFLILFGTVTALLIFSAVVTLPVKRKILEPIRPKAAGERFNFKTQTWEKT